MWSVVVLLFALLGHCSCQEEVYNVTTVNIGELPDSPNTGNRIVGGQDTTIEKYPFMVQVLVNNQLSCGGSLLTTRHVLSAAHCFVNANGITASLRVFTVRAGTTINNSGGIVRSVSAIRVHEGYNVPIRNNDVAVLMLSRRLTLSAQIATVSIPTQDSVVPDGATVWHIGWGRTHENNPVLPTILQEVSVQKVNWRVCMARYAFLEAQTLEPYPVTTSMICAGLLDVGGADACQGDSGGPLLYRGAVVGVTSWGLGCAQGAYPGVSARVANYTTWIMRAVNETTSGGIANSVSVLVLLTIIVPFATVIY